MIEILLAVLALAAGAAALVLVFDLRGKVSTLQAAQDEVGVLRREFDAARSELNELKAAAAVPPLPRTRQRGLDDLREQLRAAHLDPEPSAPDE